MQQYVFYTGEQSKGFKAFSPKETEKERTGRRFRMGRYVILVLAMAMVGLLVTFTNQEGTGHRWISRIGFFKVRSVVFLGCQGLSSQELLKAGQVPGLSGSLWDFPAKQVQANLNDFARLKKASVWRVPPQWVVILIKEREPLALIQADGIEAFDAEGRIFPLSGNERGVVLPLVTGITLSGTAPQVVDKACVNKCREIFKAAGGFLDEISEVNLSDAKNAVLYTNSGINVTLGEGNLENKFEHLREIWAKFPSLGKKVERVDLRWNGQAAVKVKS